jgi:hypothetical protein
MQTLHFERVEPIVGQSLRRARVALLGLPVAAPLVAHLAACGVGRWLWADPQDGSAELAEGGSAEELHSYLLAQHGPALALDAQTLPLPEWSAAARRTPPDLLIIVANSATDTQQALQAITAAQSPTLLITPPSLTHPCQATIILPPTPHSLLPNPQYPIPNTQYPIPTWDWTTAAPLCAGLARALLLRHTPYRRADLQELWGAGKRVLTVGGGDDALSVDWSESGPAPRRAAFRTPGQRRGKLLIAGLGSLGSVAALLLARHSAAMVIADPERVDAYNPVRQAYPLAALGRPKAQALRAGLLAAGAEDVTALDEALVDERQVAALIARHGITAALVVTGTDADFAIARALRTAGVPHVVGRCYPRARYWEAILVDGLRGPALHDVRGHLRLGPAPPPTPEQIAAYSDDGALEAEPATLVESGWAAAWMARLTAQLLAPPGLRERWLLELLASEQTCLVGGVGIERAENGPAYGITLPGMIRAWGVAEIQKLPLK